MISQVRFTDEPTSQPSRPFSEMVMRLRLAKLSHSKDNLAAAVATAASLLLPRLDALIEQRERAG